MTSWLHQNISRQVLASQAEFSQIFAEMSRKDKDQGGGAAADVDFDFFDTPRDSKSPKKEEKTAGKAEPVASTSKSHPHSYSQDNMPCSGTSDSEADSESETEIVTSRDKAKMCKIAAKVPTATNDDDYSDDSFESDGADSDSENEDLKNSGRRAPTPMSGRKGRKRTGSSDSDRSESKNVSQKHQAWGEESQGKYKENGHSKNQQAAGSRSSSQDRHYKRRSSHGSMLSTGSSSDWSSDDSDVTDVSPLHSPPTAMRGKPPKSPSYRDKQPQSGSNSSRLERLLHANRDTMDLKLLMQAVLEMEKQENQERHPKSTRKKFSVPPPAAPVKAVPQHRNNASFSNDRTRTIDLENQRLMQQIVKNAALAKQAKQKVKQRPKQQQPAFHNKVSSASINRLREQQRIEGENRAMLRRLQTTRATRDVQRDKQLREYNKHTLFGISVAAAHSSLNRKTPYETSPNPRSHSVAAWHSDTGDVTPGKYSRTRPQSATATLGGTRATSASRSRPTSATTKSRSRPVSATAAGGAKKARPQSGKHDTTFTVPEEWETGW